MSRKTSWDDDRPAAIASCCRSRNLRHRELFLAHLQLLCRLSTLCLSVDHDLESTDAFEALST